MSLGLVGPISHILYGIIMHSPGLSPEAAASVFKIDLSELHQAIYRGELLVQWNCGYPLLSYGDLLNYQLRKRVNRA